jgi:signal transduction histidine kinase
MGMTDSYLIFLYLVYGLSFVLLGAVALMQPSGWDGMRRTTSLWMIGAFSLLHGAKEFLDMWLIAVDGKHAGALWFGALLLGVSFLPLFEFGRRSLTELWPEFVSVRAAGLCAWIYVFTAAVLVLALKLSADPLAAVSALSRYLLCLPGAAIAGLALKRAFQPLAGGAVNRNMARALSGALIAYAVLGGLVTHAVAGFPAWLPTQESFLAATGMPVQLLRAACAFVAMFSLSWLVRQQAEATLLRERARTAELRQAQNQLVAQQKLAALGQLTATVNHELRNPLAVIRTSLYSLQRLLKKAGIDAATPMARIERSMDRCTTIIEDMLEFARLKQPELQSLCLDSWVAEVVADYPLPAQVEPRMNLNAGPARVAIDPERMGRALVNLLDNAVQAMAAGDGDGGGAAELFISTRHDDGAVVLLIEDCGPGIVNEDEQQLFEPLFSTKSFGVGLGLAIVRNIVEAHGGSISIGNRAGARGAAATLTLPFAAG